MANQTGGFDLSNMLSGILPDFGGGQNELSGINPTLNALSAEQIGDSLSGFSAPGGFSTDALSGGGGGIFGDIFSTEGMEGLSSIVGAGKGIFDIYSGMQQQKMMEDMMKYNVDVGNRNLSNQAILTNQRLAGRARSRDASRAGYGEAPTEYTPVSGEAIKFG